MCDVTVFVWLWVCVVYCVKREESKSAFWGHGQFSPFYQTHTRINIAAFLSVFLCRTVEEDNQEFVLLTDDVLFQGNTFKGSVFVSVCQLWQLPTQDTCATVETESSHTHSLLLTRRRRCTGPITRDEFTVLPMNVRDKQWISGPKIHRPNGICHTGFYISSAVRKRRNRRGLFTCPAPGFMILGFLLQVRNFFWKIISLKHVKVNWKHNSFNSQQQPLDGV